MSILDKKIRVDKEFANYVKKLSKEHEKSSRLVTKDILKMLYKIEKKKKKEELYEL